MASLAAMLCAAALLFFSGCAPVADAYREYDRNFDRSATVGAATDARGDGKAYVEFTISRRGAAR